MLNGERCVDCHACEVACASAHNLEPGIKPIKVAQQWSGKFPEVRISFSTIVCLQCESPACREACPAEAITKRVEDGVVVVDADKCNGCQACLAACSYGVPQFSSDGMMQKCDLCTGLGREPACVDSCMTDALHIQEK